MSQDYFGFLDQGVAGRNKTASELASMPQADAALWRYTFTWAMGGGTPGTFYFRSVLDRDAFKRTFERLESYVFHGEGELTR